MTCLLRKNLQKPMKRKNQLKVSKTGSPNYMVSNIDTAVCETVGRRGGLMVSALDSRSGGPGWSPGKALHCVLGQNTLLS